MENMIADRLRAMARLQMIDSKLDKIHRLRGSLPEEVNDLEDDLEGLEMRKARIDEDIKKLKSEIAARKNKIVDFHAQIKKYEEQQMNVKNNREYDALHKEIEYANLEILTSERKIRQYEEQIESKEEQLAVTSRKIDDKQSELDEKRKELEIIINETEKEEKTLREISDASMKQVEERFLAGYRKIRNSMRNGLAVVSTDRGACGGCFSIIPPQIHIELKQHDRLIHCENCGRILVDQAFFNEVEEDMHKQGIN